jgi:acetate kinase
VNDTILVLNCGSSSIKFALFDADVYPVPRKPLWAGKVDGIGSTNASLVEPQSPPVALALPHEQPYHAALQVVRASVETRTEGRLPVALVHRVVHGGSKYGAPSW